MQDEEVRRLNRQFKGLWIPAEILAVPGLTAVEKMLWADIDSFTGHGSTWFKSRETAAQELGVSQSTVSRSMKVLLDSEIVKMVGNDGRYRHFVASLPGQIDASAESIKEPSRVKMPIEPSQNETIENKEVNKKRTRKYYAQPKDLDEVVTYFAKWGHHDQEDCATFMDYYTANGWTQGRGKPIKDWMATARNWMRNGKKWNTEKRGFDPNNFTPDGIGDFVANG